MKKDLEPSKADIEAALLRFAAASFGKPTVGVDQVRFREPQPAGLKRTPTLMANAIAITCRGENNLRQLPDGRWEHTTSFHAADGTLTETCDISDEHPMPECEALFEGLQDAPKE